MLTALVALTAVGQPYTLTYDEHTLPQVWQNTNRVLFLADYNPAARKTHDFGSPNAHSPWRHPGGTAGQFPFEISLWMPAKIHGPYPAKDEQLRRHPAVPHTAQEHWQWTYPVGTTFTLRLYQDEAHKQSGDPFTAHVAAKTERGWEHEELPQEADAPAGYEAPADCRKCHEDVGKFAAEVGPDQDYYGWVRGSDTRFSLHPFNADVGNGAPLSFTAQPAVRQLFDQIEQAERRLEAQ